MKKGIIMPVALLLLAGCSGAPLLDQEFGEANRQSFEMQIANPDYRFADRVPEGTSGLVAEGIMEVYTNDFDRESTPVEVFQLGLDGKK